MITEVYDAFKSAGAHEEKARRAAETLSHQHLEILSLSGRMNLIQWMVGFNLAFSVAILWKMFSAS